MIILNFLDNYIASMDCEQPLENQVIPYEESERHPVAASRYRLLER